MQVLEGCTKVSNQVKKIKLEFKCQSYNFEILIETY